MDDSARYNHEDLLDEDIEPPRQRVGTQSLTPTTTKIYLAATAPKFLHGDALAPAPMVTPVVDKDARMVVAGREGSALVRDIREKRERKRQVRDSLAIESTTTQSGRLTHLGDERTKLDRNLLMKQRESLPAFATKERFLEVVRENQLVVVKGETGSGKTTQLPQFLADALGGKVVVTQPRRVAAVSVAARVALERDSKLGDEVGYSIRFEDKTSSATKIKFLTDGILLRECMSDPLLDNYKAVMIDEAHERNLNTDIMLGLLKRILARRLDLKVIITSATLDADKFTSYFGGAPTFEISGRTFPVHVQHLSVPPTDYAAACVRQVVALHVQQPLPGDILVFLTGQEDIEAVCQGIKERVDQLQVERPIVVLPLYSQLPSDIQQQVFLPAAAGHRKVVVATNIAETSLTVEGVKFIVDSGYTKMNVYQPRAKMDALVVVPISRAAANQRAGRAGRTAEGWAYRMYTQRQEVAEMLSETVPEIKRTNLAQAFLLLKSLGVGDVESFPWLDAPAPSAVAASLYDLWAIGAIDGDTSKLTPLGSKLAKFPLDPHMARLVLASIEEGCSAEMLTIIAMLTVPSVFVRTLERAAEADKAREKFAAHGSDHLTLLNVWSQWLNHKKSDAWASRNFLRAKSLRRAADVRQQLVRLIGVPLKSCGADLAKVRRALCMGYFHQAARTHGLRMYSGLRTGIVAHLHPTSVLSGGGAPPDYIVYHELILTSQPYMAVVTAVEPEWLLKYGSIFYSSKPPEPEKISAPQLDTTTDPKETPTPVATTGPKFKRRNVGSRGIAKTRAFRGA